MEIFELAPLSVVAGVLTVILTVLVRFYFPFRYQYFCYLVKRRPNLVKKLLLRSYRKNKTAVGLLDKATSEILEGSYDNAERHLLEGIYKVVDRRGIQNQLIRTFFYSHLSWLLYYKENYKESLEISLRLYEKVPSTPNLLALITCNFARIGEIGRAIEVMGNLSRKEKANSCIILTCEAEIEAAKGNIQRAVQLFNQAKGKKTYTSIYFIRLEIEKRIRQLKKTA